MAKIFFQFAVIASYFLLGKLGHFISDFYGGASPVWLPTGLGIALVVFYGWRSLIGIFVAQLLIRFSFTESFEALHLLAGLGSVLEASLGAFLFQFFGQRFSFMRELDHVMRLAVVSFLAPFPSVILGTSSLYFQSLVSVNQLPITLLTWWFGNALGILLFLPLCLEAFSNRFKFERRQLVEALIVGLVFFVASRFIFFAGPLFLPPFAFPLLFLACCFCSLFSIRISLLAVCAAAIIGTYEQSGPFTGKFISSSLVDLVLYLFALALCAESIPGLLKSSSKRVVAMTFGLAWMALASAFYFLIQNSETQEFRRAATLISQKEEWLQDRLNIYENVFRSAVGLFKSSNEVTPDEWKTFVQTSEVLNRFPGVLGLGVIFRVEPADKSLFFQLVRDHWGLDDFEIKEVPRNLMFTEASLNRDPVSQAEDIDFHYLITFIEPIERNLAARGLDVSSEISRKIAADLSRTKNQFVVTPPIRLVQDQNEGYGFLAYFPIPGKTRYQLGRNRLELEAWIYAPVRYDDFLPTALDLKGLFNLRVFDKSVDDQIVPIFEFDQREEGVDWKTFKTTEFSFAGRQLQLEWMKGPQFPASTSTLAGVTAFVGVLVSLLLVALVTSLYGNEAKARELAAQMTNQLHDQKQKLIEASRLSSLGEMAAGIAHEINNPLAIILGASSLLQNRLQEQVADPEYMKSKLMMIQKTANRIAKIIESLRAYARDGSLDSLEWTSVARIVQSTLELCGERFRHHEIGIDVQLQPELELLCREVQISQVLVNLLNNSFDALMNQSIRQVVLRAYESNERLIIEVEDTGSGIPVHLRDKILQPFFTTKEVGKGTGIGLSISASIVSDHGGIFYLDPHSTNTRFRMEFPAACFRHSKSADKQNA